MLEAGKILQERYLIEKQIGQGGMGAVYVATDRRFGSTVAIKETLFVGESFEKAFEREARLLNSLRHPALPNVRDYFFENHKQYLVMEFIAGEDLSEKLEQNGKAFDLKDVLDWTQQLLKALDFLHTQEMPVIHRDIKPQNLKLTPRGQIILLDFGLAKGNPTDSSHLTNVNSVFGYSRNYASLEQMQGTGTDPRSDIYSLAATVYHLVTGVPPVDALTRAMKVLSEHADPLIPADEVHAQVPKGIANILAGAMNLNANHRPASAKELSEMLENGEDYENFADGKAVAARAVPTSFLNQDTQMFPPSNEKQTLIHQAVVSGDNAEFETKIKKDKYSSRDFETNVVAPKLFGEPKTFGKSALAIGTVLSLLLLVFGGAAMYFSNSNSAAETSIDAGKAAANDSVSQSNVTATFTATGSNLNVPNPPAAPPAPTAANAWNQPAKNDNQTSAKADDKKTNSVKKNKSVMVFDDPEDGRVTIADDKIETDEVIITDKGVVFKKPQNPNNPQPPNVVFKEGTLNLKQLEKLKQLRQKAEEARRNAEKNKANIPTTPETDPN